ncbi:MAG: DNA repair protein RecO [Alphaproteobacteria bacterium]|nr:DNA repair protein RecO [Alphaproteobacteria bacterium]
MRFVDEGYIINCRRHGESSLILTVFSQTHGKVCGYVKSGAGKKSSATFQAGNLVKIDAWSRLDENMLSLRVELIAPQAVDFLASGDKLRCLSCFCALCNICLPELQPADELYALAAAFISAAADENWLAAYCFWEYGLLDFLGVGLDLNKCVATGSRNNLAFVSPKSGCAVSYSAGLPYAERLFTYPRFIIEQNRFPAVAEMAELLRMTEFFLNKNFFAIHNLKFPICRVSLGADLIAKP